MKRKTLNMVFLGILILLVLVAFILYSNIGKNPEKTEVLETEQEIIGFSAMSSVSALKTTQDLGDTLDNQNFQNNTRKDLEVLNNIKDLESNFYLINTFMGEKKGFEVEVLEDGEKGYENTLIINSVGLSGEKQTHTFYYNETIEDGNKSEGEYESVIEGIMILEEVVYNLSGKREVDEEEESFEMTAKKDEDNYVNMDYEFEEDTNETSKEFEYELFKEGKMIKKMEIDFEQEEDETEMSFLSIEGDYEIKYDFEREEEDDKIIIEIEYEISEFGDVIDKGEIEAIINPENSGNEKNITYKIETEDEETIVVDK